MSPDIPWNKEPDFWQSLLFVCANQYEGSKCSIDSVMGLYTLPFFNHHLSLSPVLLTKYNVRIAEISERDLSH